MLVLLLHKIHKYLLYPLTSYNNNGFKHLENHTKKMLLLIPINLVLIMTLTV